MGSSESKVTEIVDEHEGDEIQKIKIPLELSNQLDQLKKEVDSVEPSIQDHVKETIFTVKDATIIRYKDLSEREKIVDHVSQMFGKFPLAEFLIDTTTTLVSIMSSSEEMKERLCWYERKMVKCVGRKVYGVEVYYKIKMLDETKGLLSKTKDTVVLIAYKCLNHAMNLDPADYPNDDEEYIQLKFE